MKTRITAIISLVLSLTLLSACRAAQTSAPAGSAAPDTASAYQKITASDGKTLMDSGDSFILVDVRRADEYETAHIPGAINIPNESLESTQPEALPDLDATIIVYCRTGVRSKQAADKLVDIGFTDVKDMGGIVDWPYETVTGTEPAADVSSGDESAAASDGLMGIFSAEDIEGN